jgi:hypothetical protein
MPLCVCVSISVTGTEYHHVTSGSCSRAMLHSTRRKEAEQLSEKKEEEAEEERPITEAKETYYRGKVDAL